MDEETPTLGEARVGVSFNPSGNPAVHVAKITSAGLIDLASREARGATAEAARCFSIAMTKYEEACMWLVKGLTKPAPKETT